MFQKLQVASTETHRSAKVSYLPACDNNVEKKDVDVLNEGSDLLFKGIMKNSYDLFCYDFSMVFP